MLFVLFQLPLLSYGQSYTLSLESGKTVTDLNFVSLSDSTLSMKYLETGRVGIIPISSIVEIERSNMGDFSTFGLHSDEYSFFRGLLIGIGGGGFLGALTGGMVNVLLEPEGGYSETDIGKNIAVGVGCTVLGSVIGYRTFSDHSLGFLSDEYDLSTLSPIEKHKRLEILFLGE